MYAIFTLYCVAHKSVLIAFSTELIFLEIAERSNKNVDSLVFLRNKFYVLLSNNY